MERELKPHRKKSHFEVNIFLPIQQNIPPYFAFLLKEKIWMSEQKSVASVIVALLEIVTAAQVSKYTPKMCKSY